MTPDMDLSPPALCNLFFPDQVGDFGYQHQIKNEITRVVAQGQWGYVENQALQTFFPVYVAPSIDIETGEDNHPQSGLTVEETYRGINPEYFKFDGPFYTALQKHAEDDGKLTAAGGTKAESILPDA